MDTPTIGELALLATAIRVDAEEYELEGFESTVHTIEDDPDLVIALTRAWDAARAAGGESIARLKGY